MTLPHWVGRRKLQRHRAFYTQSRSARSVRLVRLK